MNEAVSYISLNNPVSPYIMTLAFIVFFVFYWNLSVGLRTRIAKKSYFLISFLQMLVFVLIMINICDPLIKSVKIKKSKGALITLFDGSASTKMRGDAPWGMIFKRNNPILDNIKNFDPFYYIFSEELKPLNPLKIELPDLKDGTEIIASIEAAIKQTEVEDERVILLFSDGRDLIEEKDLDTLKLYGIPVYTVGLGERRKKYSRIKDINIKEMDLSDQIVRNTPLKIKTKINVSGIENQDLKIILRINDKVIYKDSLTVISGQKEYLYEYEWLPLDVGDNVVTIEIPQIAGEYNTFNNIISKKVEVIEKGNDILFIIGKLRWEYSILFKFMEESTNVNIHQLVFAGKNKIISNNKKLLSGFPTLKTLLDYGTVVLCDITPDFLDDTQIMDLDNFVAQKGGSIIFLLNKNFFANKNRLSATLRKLIPVNIPDSPVFYQDDVFCRINDKEQLIDGVFDSNLLDMKLKVSSIPLLSKIKSSAKAMLIGDRNIDSSDNPVVSAWRQYGAGMVLYSGMVTSWLWQRSLDEQLNLFYNQYWTSVFSLALGSRVRVSQSSFNIDTEKDLIFKKTPVNIRINISPVLIKDKNYSLSLFVTSPDGKRFSVPWKMPFGGKGIGFSSFTPVNSGIYDIKASLKIDGKEMKDSVVLNVRDDLKEFENIELNEASLKRISMATNGKYKSYVDYLDSPFKFERELGLYKEVSYAPIWTTKIFFLIEVFLFCLLWIIRRSVNME